jgi:YbbR domain-containing protein
MSRPVYNFLRRRVLNNLGLKLLSLALAVGLWLAVAVEPVSEVAVDAPIELHNMPPNLEISSERIPKAQVRLRGPERIIRRLQPSDVFAEIELTGVAPGQRTFDLKIHQPRELTVVQVVPSDVHLAFDLRLTREVPVHPRVVGFVDGYGISQLRSDPPTIKITGPKQHVESVDAAITDPIDITGTIGQKTVLRYPYVSDPLVQVASPDPVRIVITMEKTSTPNGH